MSDDWLLARGEGQDLDVIASVINSQARLSAVDVVGCSRPIVLCVVIAFQAILLGRIYFTFFLLFRQICFANFAYSQDGCLSLCKYVSKVYALPFV